MLDNFSTGHRANLEPLGRQSWSRATSGRTSAWRRREGVEVVFHQGALPSVPRSIQDPLTSNAVNVEGTLNVLLAARDAGVRRVVFASSSSVYGDAPGMPRQESQALAPLAPYAVVEARRRAVLHGRAPGITAWRRWRFGTSTSSASARIPLSGYAAVIPKFIRMMLDGARPTIFGDGETSRDFTHVENVVEANLAAAAAPAAAGRMMNIAVGSSHTLNELVRHASTVARLGRRARVRPVSSRRRLREPRGHLARPGADRLRADRGVRGGPREDDRVDCRAEGSPCAALRLDGAPGSRRRGLRARGGALLRAQPRLHGRCRDAGDDARARAQGEG